jgi:hypothetical protein
MLEKKPLVRALPGGGDPLNIWKYRTQRLENPEDLWQPIYDRVNYSASGTRSLSFFSVPRGQTATLIRGSSAISGPKGYRDTNLDSAGVVPSKVFKIVGVSVAYLHLPTESGSNIAQIRRTLKNEGYFKFTIVDKDILVAPLFMIPESDPILASAASTTASNTTIDYAIDIAGGSVGKNMYRLAIPITLMPFENFNVTLYFENAPTIPSTTDIMVILHGFMRRPT